MRASASDDLMIAATRWTRARCHRTPAFRWTRHGAVLALLIASACGGGGGGGGDPATTGRLRTGFGPTDPAAVNTVRLVFVSDGGYQCCVALDPDSTPVDPGSGQYVVTLDDLPPGPGTIAIAGFATDFAPAPSGVSNTCTVDPAGIGRACDASRSATPSFDSDPQPVVITAGGETDAGTIETYAVPFLLEGTLRPLPNRSTGSPVQVAFTVADAESGIAQESVIATITDSGGRSLAVSLQLQACDDGAGSPCSPGGELDVSGFLAQSDPIELPSGASTLSISARNLAAFPRTLSYSYGFRIAAVPPTPTGTRPSTPTVGTAAPTATFTRSPTATSPQPTSTPTQTQTPPPTPVQISFAHGAPFAISPPEAFAFGDFNQDGRDDVAVSSPRSEEVNVLLGNDDGHFTPGTVIHFGEQPAGVAAGDLNGDNVPDLAVADPPMSGVFIMIATGTGSFGSAMLQRAGSAPFGVAIADFDGMNGNDLAVSDRRNNQVVILLNNGQDAPTFRAARAYRVGAGPEDIVTADFNGDGAADLATLNAGEADAKDITLLLFTGLDEGVPLFTTAATLAVGERPSDLVVGEFNSDGLPDLALINRPFDQDQGEVNVLLSRGNGVLAQTDPILVPCPATSVDRNCPTRALAAGRFNGDEATDLAVSVADQGEGRVSDIVRIYAGTGDGGFFLGESFQTEADPGVMGVGDITGDDALDLVVGSQERGSVQVLINVTGQSSTP